MPARWGNASIDSWDGFSHEREEIFDFIVKNKIRNVVILSGDSHLVSVHNHREGIREYQFYQDKPGEAELRVVPIGALRVETLQRVAHGLERKLLGRVRIRLKVVDRIKLTPAGKFSLVDQRIEDTETLTRAHTTGR